MTKIVNLVKSFTADESGEVGAEYALLLVLIALGLVAIIMAFTGQIQAAFNRAVQVLSSANAAAGGS